MIRKSVFLCSLLLMLGSFFSIQSMAAVNDAGIKVDWGYRGNKGPVHWGQLSPAFSLCSMGKEQSPINIFKKAKSSNNRLTLHYQTAPLILLEKGDTALLLGAEQTIIDDGHTIQVNFPHTKEVIEWDGVVYSLVQFHIHTPSENQLQGQAFPLELHFVHQGPQGQVLVIGVFVKSGAFNPVLQKIIVHAPTASKKEFTIPNEQVNPEQLLPTALAHYQFKGSLTTPPCTEGLQWLVMKNVITATPAQIVSLRAAIGGTNARPTQPLMARKIYFTAD